MPQSEHSPESQLFPSRANQNLPIDSRMPTYRPNVAFILSNAAGEILVCERSDWAGCWQFAQGGVKSGETFIDALHREVEEELCLKHSITRCSPPEGRIGIFSPTAGKKRVSTGRSNIISWSVDEPGCPGAI